MSSARASGAGPAGVVLFPGAGTGADHPGLAAIEAAVTSPVRRVDFAYRVTGRRGPRRWWARWSRLHPPGRPERSRVDHLGAIDVPVLVVSGTGDAFGTPDELAGAAAQMAGPVTMVLLDGARHGLEGRDDDVARTVRDWLDR